MSIPAYFFHKLIQDLAQDKDIPFFAWKLAQVLNRPVLITSAVHRILAYQDPSGLNLKLGEFFPVPTLKIDEEEFFSGYCNVLIEGQYNSDRQSLTYAYLPLQSSGRCFGHCIILNGNTNQEDSLTQQLGVDDKEYITQVSLIILLALKSDWKFQTDRQQFQDEFIRDVLYNNYDSKASIYEKANLWHWDLQGPLIVVVLECAVENLDKVRDLIPRIFNRQNPISASINNQLVLILRAKDLEKTKLKITLNTFLDEFLGRLKNYGVAHACIGVGSTVPAVTDLYKNYQEAKVVLELGKIFDRKPICYFEEMGFLKFIFTQPALELQEFSQRILGPLIQYDLETDSELLHSLRVYLDCKCQIPECAKTLYVHVNTLRNRIKKIEELTGFDIHKTDHLVNMFIALQILSLDKNS